MKIISATCEVDDDDVRAYRYFSEVKVMSDSHTETGTGNGADPNEAVHRALSNACDKFTKQLHESLNIGVQINF